MKVSQVLNELMMKSNTSAYKISKETGISDRLIGYWRNGEKTPSAENLLTIATYFGTSVDYLLTGKETNLQLNVDEQELLEYYNKLPEHGRIKLIGRAAGMVDVYSEQEAERVKQHNRLMTTINIAEVAAGAGVSTPFTIDNAFSPRDFPADVVTTGADCGVPINGDSMEPQFPNGCIVWVKCTNEVNYGDVIIAVLNGEPYCKIYQPDGLHSYNKNYEIIHVNEQDNFSIFGKVIGYYESSK